MTKIVILDGFTTNPGDLSWEAFETLGMLEVFDRTPPELVISRCKEANIILTNKVNHYPSPSLGKPRSTSKVDSRIC